MAKARAASRRRPDCSKDGAAALDAIEAGIRVVEADPDVHSVGPNSWPNILGALQLDAAVMDGTTRRSGAVGAIEGFAHPISIARAVMERLPHEILVGEGAARFAREIGAEQSPPPSNLVEETWRGVVQRNGVRARAAELRSRAAADRAGARRDRSGNRARHDRLSRRRTRRETSARAPARPAGPGNIPAGSATRRSSAPAPMPTRAMAPPPAPTPAR